MVAQPGRASEALVLAKLKLSQTETRVSPVQTRPTAFVSEGEQIPFTPFHFGPAILLGVLFHLDMKTLLIASVILDLEPLFVLIFGLDFPLHGFFHSFMGASIVSLLLVFTIAFIHRSSNKKDLFFASFLCAYIHVLLDSPLYTDMKPFFPFTFNPFESILGGFEVYSLCILSLIFGVGLHILKISKNQEE